jgi:hypothetical protein
VNTQETKPRSYTEFHSIEPKVVKNQDFIKTPCHSVYSVVLILFFFVSFVFLPLVLSCAFVRNFRVNVMPAITDY